MLMRTEVRVALAVAFVAALWVLAWLAAPYMPQQRFAEMCPWPHCEEDIPPPQ